MGKEKSPEEKIYPGPALYSEKELIKAIIMTFMAAFVTTRDTVLEVQE